ncbi:MAG: hypothetical protein SCH71_01960 [Desulfobulbaceae bacterium]|nr:hypothetical protein [Desulfobulbaceae bacterium]
MNNTDEAIYSAARGARFLIYAVFASLLTSLVMCGVSSAALMPDYEHLAPVTNSVKGPMAMAVDREGRLYVTEAGSNRILVLSRSGRYLASLTGLDNPISVAVDAGGRILVGSKNKGSVEVYAADFTPLFKLGSGDGEFSRPNGICVDSSGRIYVVDMGKDIVRMYDSSGRFTGSLGSPGNNNGQFYRPVAMTIDEAAGEIIVLDRQLVAGTAKQGARIQFFTMAGDWLRGFTRNSTQEGGMVKPQGITVDSLSRIYVSDSYQNAVLVYDNTGVFLGAVYDLDNPLRAPLGIIIDLAGRLYVTSRMADSIEVYGIDRYTGIEVFPGMLKFAAKEGDADPVSQNISVINSGTTTINLEAAADASWLSLSDESSVLDRDQAVQIDVTVDPTGLAPGEYTGMITVSAGPGTIDVVQVVLTVAPSAKLTVTPSELSLAAQAGTAPSPVTLTLVNTGAAPLYWSLSSDQPWLENNIAGILAESGEESVNVAIKTDAAALAPGTYYGTITITGHGALGSPATIGVTLMLSARQDPPGNENPSIPAPGTPWKGNLGRKWAVVSQIDGVALNAIWGSSGSDIFAVGDNGAILHYDGRNWTQENTGIDSDLKGVWGASASSVYVVGENGLILHHDGENLTDVSPSFPGIIRNIWCGDESTKCFAVGQNGAIFDDDAGSRWSMHYSAEIPESLNGIWGSSESDIYAVGDSGTILNYDGSGWTLINSGFDMDLHDVWGSADDNVFAVGRNGTILHFNGSAWAQMDSGTTAALLGIWGNADDEVYAVGEDGTMLLLQSDQWLTLETGIDEDLNDAWGGRKKEVYAVGSDGSIIFVKTSFPWSLLFPIFNQNGKQVQLPVKQESSR